MIPVCSGNSALANTTLNLNELTQNRLIIRESGSGSRAIVEEALHQQNVSLDAFAQQLTLNNINTIKSLVKRNYGITFIYEEAVKEELASGELAPISIKELQFNQSFHFICPKNSLFTQHYLDLFKFFKKART